MSQSEKLVVLVLEGVSNQLLDPWCEEGHLPNITGLRKQQGGYLQSLSVPYESSALQTAFTGYAPGDHGVFSYWKVHNPEYIPQIWESNQLYCPYLWQREEFGDRKFGVINLFGTHPPYPINGSMITYLFKQSLHACYPKNLLRNLAKEGLGYGQDVSMFYRGQPREEFLRGVLQVEDYRVNVALRMLEDVDVLIVNLTLVDRVSHFYWQEIEDGSPLSLEETALYQAYQLADRAVGEFLKKLDDHSHLLLFSDIGFGPLREFVSVNELLKGGGFLTRIGDHGVDWEKTVAFESVQGSHGINIHRKGAYSKGIVDPADYAQIREEVAIYLKQAINPKTGLPYFVDVVPREMYYSGQHMEEAPDLILQPADQRYVPLGDDYWAHVVHRDYQSGWHRSECFWTGAGPALNGIKENCAIGDITPTIFRLCGRDVPVEFPGRSLTGSSFLTREG